MGKVRGRSRFRSNFGGVIFRRLMGVLNQKRWIFFIAILNGVGLAMLTVNTLSFFNGSHFTRSAFINIYF